MPPEGYTAVTISEELEDKLIRIMLDSGCDGLPEAIEYAADEVLARENELTEEELVDMLADRIKK